MKSSWPTPNLATRTYASGACPTTTRPLSRLGQSLLSSTSNFLRNSVRSLVQITRSSVRPSNVAFTNPQGVYNKYTSTWDVPDGRFWNGH
ncbi:hypothetical protein PF008_g15069 [Phytophthora fragariae]|uniref:Uncharacterized protein n=1 Tax=Phytophthora fragariae TaxID=53985 RepID=A0A6G0RF61_9STRA|nr:hypothetical protein PF008_g15069 [Phytophthora fragariae]